MKVVDARGIVTCPGRTSAAAPAELAGLVVLHVDEDFDLIAEVTGQPVERLRLAS